MLIGRHLENVRFLDFELNLAPSEKRPTYEFSSDSGLCARAKVIELKIEENTSLGKLVSHFKFGSCTSFRFMDLMKERQNERQNERQ